jgi:hypothetical protein
MAENVWVVPHEGQWAVRREGSTRVSSNHATKAEAETEGRRLARQDAVELIIQRADGTIESRDSYGNDPASRRG